MMQLKITLIRSGNERNDMTAALAIMEIDGTINDVNLAVGVLKDDEGLLAVWELEEF